MADPVSYGPISDPSQAAAASGSLLPQTYAAYQRDPRRELIAAMLANSQQNIPLYNGKATAAAAITKALPGIMMARLNNEYMDANTRNTQDLRDSMAAMMGHPASGVPGAGDAAVPPDFNRAATILAGNPMLAGQGFQMAASMAQKRMEMLYATREKLASAGSPLTMDDNGNLVMRSADEQKAALGTRQAEAQSTATGTTSGNLAAEAAGKPAVINATAQPEANAAALKEAAITPALVDRAGKTALAEVPGKVASAVQTAQGTAPIETFKKQFEPLVDRQTGEVTIPGIADPKMVQQIMAAFGTQVTGKAGSFALGPLAAGATAAPTPSPTAPAAMPAHTDMAPAPGAAVGSIQAPPPAKPDVPAAPAAAVPTAPVPMPPMGLGSGPAGSSPALPPPPPPKPLPPPAMPAAASPAAPPLMPVAAPLSPPAPAPGAPVPAGLPPKTSVPVGTMEPKDEIPSMPMPSGLLPKGPGTIIQGRDPVAITAADEAIKEGTKQYAETSEKAKAATEIQSQLGTMKAQLDSGKLITSMTGDVREKTAGFLYAISGGDRDLAFRITGIDPSAAEVMAKESTRLGFALARTMGAREAAQIVTGAIKANPNIGNTIEGNRMVIGLLDKTAQHAIDEQKYADAWFTKNGHYIGAQGWFNANHPEQEYTSKVVPYEAPRLGTGRVDVSKLIPNVTYRGPNGPAVFNGSKMVPAQ